MNLLIKLLKHLRKRQVSIKNSRRSIHICILWRLKEELDYIYNHMSERLTLKDISNQLYVSKSNLSSQFHILMGMGFKNMLIL